MDTELANPSLSSYSLRTRINELYAHYSYKINNIRDILVLILLFISYIQNPNRCSIRFSFSK